MGPGLPNLWCIHTDVVGLLQCVERIVAIWDRRPGGASVRSPFGGAGARLALTVRLREIGTGISESKQRVPIFLRDVRGGKQVPILDRNSEIHSQDHRGTGTNPWAWPGSDPAATIVASSQP